MMPMTKSLLGRSSVAMALAFTLVAFKVGCKDGNGNDMNTGGGGGTAGGQAGAAGTQGDQAGQGGQGGQAGESIDAAAPDTRPAPRFGIESLPATQTCTIPAALDQLPEKLSLTGCFESADPRKPLDSLIPYSVSSPLWSDHADKERFLALPVGAKIRVKDCRMASDWCGPPTAGATTWDDGKLDVPPGSVLIKSFKLGGKFIETRFLVRFDEDNWLGYTYEWREDQSDADLLPDEIGGKLKPVTNAGQNQIWHFPDHAQCLRCHTEAAGRSLGPELRQMNSTFRYPSGIASNQIETLEHLGVFEKPIARPLPPPYPDPLADSAGATVAARARAYLHANCAICHRPKGNFEAMDMRFETALADMKICNADPEKGELGITGAKLLVPGRPGKSLVTLRMHALDQARMPEIGSRVVDEDGVAVIEQWIGTLAACP
jgi:uncharacterized repeat protein (TIGR03806 family)